MRLRALRRLRAGLLLGGVLLVPSLAAGQPAPQGSPPRRVFEYWFGPTLVFPGFDGTVTSDFPATLDYGESTGRATQRLTLRAPRHLGVEGGIGIFPTRHAGIQIRLNYVTRDLSGTSSPFAVTLDYTAMQPPDYVPRQYHTDSTRSWPAPTGTATQLTLSVDGAVRWDVGARLSGTVSGGLSFMRTKGSAESLAYTRYWMGGHSVLFSSTYAASFDYGPVTAIGFDIGGDIGVNIAGPLDLLVDIRYVRAGAITPDVRLTGFVEPTEFAGDVSVATVEARMAPIRASFNASFARIFFGVRVRP
ncbi:MAG: hypothetical protein IMZ44_18115 [Planctomycetes bacterium]|nr:hypothetical protein [Planctomycetota bacterium]